MRAFLVAGLVAACGAQMQCNEYCDELNDDNDKYNYGQLVVYDPSCKYGGVGCNAKGKNQLCRFCTWQGSHSTPACPQCACSQQNVAGCNGEPKAAKVETNSSSGCWCNGKNCNFSPFPNDNRCVCGPKSSDWKTPEQCGSSPPAPAPSPNNCCQCNGKCCNFSPFQGDDRCVCGPKSSDWKTPQQCGREEIKVVKPETNSSLGCWCNGKNCNFSPFPNDNRCVCGPKSSDWKTPAQCGASPSPGGCGTSYRNDCGYKGINEASCQAKGCCWSPAANGVPWCYYPGAEAAKATMVQDIIV